MGVNFYVTYLYIVSYAFVIKWRSVWINDKYRRETLVNNLTQADNQKYGGKKFKRQIYRLYFRYFLGDYQSTVDYAGDYLYFLSSHENGNKVFSDSGIECSFTLEFFC